MGCRVRRRCDWSREGIGSASRTVERKHVNQGRRLLREGGWCPCVYVTKVPFLTTKRTSILCVSKNFKFFKFFHTPVFSSRGFGDTYKNTNRNVYRK